MSVARKMKLEYYAEMKENSKSEARWERETQRALEEIDACQNTIDLLNEKASEDILKVEQKYNEFRKPFFDKRNTMIERIEKFWITTLVNHPHLSTLLDEEEQDCLNHLEKLDVEEFEDINFGYRIKFFFEPNPYFENEVLIKEIQLGAHERCSKSTPIQWKEGRNIMEIIKGRNESNQKQGRKRRLECRTFFTWFEEECDPSTDEISEIIKDDLWPNPLQFFLSPDVEVDTNEVEEDDDDDGDEDGRDDYGGDDEDDDGEDNTSDVEGDDNVVVEGVVDEIGLNEEDEEEMPEDFAPEAYSHGGLSVMMESGSPEQEIDMPALESSSTSPVKDPLATPDKDPFASPDKDPLASPDKDPLDSPAKDPLVSPAKDPLVSPAKDPLTSPAKDPLASPAKDSLVSPAKDPLASPAKDPLASPAKDPLTSPDKDPLASPAKDPLASPDKDPLASPAKDPFVSPAKDPLASPAKDPLASPAKDPLASETQPERSAE